jgi:phenylacetaldehyde dehydrogenase
MGPLASTAQQSRVLGFIESGREQGAEVAAGGEGLDHPGAYVKPTVLIGANRDMKVVREEIFGPVLAVIPFSEGDDVVALANDTEYGLSASIWTQNVNKAHQFVKKVKAGNVWVNVHNILDPAMPFGGIKNSGYGHELSEEAIRSHTHSKSAVMHIA